MAEQLVGVAVGLEVVVVPGCAGVEGAHHTAQLDPDRQPVGVDRVKRDRADMMGPWSRWKRPGRLARQLAQRGQALPVATAVGGAVEVAGLSAGVQDRDAPFLVGRRDCHRHHPSVSESPLVLAPRSATVLAYVHAIVESADQHTVGIARIDGDTVRADAAQHRLGLDGGEREPQRILAGDRKDPWCPIVARHHGSE